MVRNNAKGGETWGGGGGVMWGVAPPKMRIIPICWAIKMRKIPIKLNKWIMSTIFNDRM
jgi:hypothetical protein